MILLCTYNVNFILTIVMLDGHEVTDTEKAFLMNWKTMRKARRRLQKQSLGQMPFFDEASSSGPTILPSIPVPPTLPALPARQLPRRSKKPNNHESQIKRLPQLVISNEIDGSFKLPELIPYQSIITHQGPLLNALSNEKPWRTIEST
jgi:hypothetical protein